MRKILFSAAAMVLLVGQAFAQRAMDKLDRGLVAVGANNGVFVSWRVFAEDADNVKFNLYRDGALVNAQPLTVSNYTDAAGSASSSYVVKTVVDGVETGTSEQALTSANNYFEIKIAPVPSNADGTDISAVYEPNDATVADLDGDGRMEILLKLRNTEFHGNGYPMTSTDFDIIQVYKLDGTLMWWIDCGRNMVDFQSNEINIAAYDWDQDGKAECILRGADGMVVHLADGTEYVVGDPNVNTLGDVQGSGGVEKFTHSGAEYLLYLNGETGKPYQVSEYPLKRLEDGETSLTNAWGDGYGHRSSKHFFGAPYLDGRKPSIFLARGIYTRHKMIAYDVNPATHELVERWRWNCSQSGSPWYGQGYHNYCVADVDWDGRDEIVFGSMVIDDNGRGLSTTGLGHGDSQHVGDFNPYVYGLEMVACNEDNPANNYRDATTSRIYYRVTGTSDDGRAIAGNFSNNYPGAQFITAHDSGTLISTVTNKHLDGAGSTGTVAQNFRIYWDGDLLDETFNGSAVRNSNGVIYKYPQGAIHTFTGTLTNNDTKATPCFQGDILGDWREELILRADDNKSIRIYTTTIPTQYRIYTLLHDPQYRNAMVWQMNGYNQTPHPSFFLGELEGITQAPPAPTMNGRQEVAGSISAADNGKNLIMSATTNASASVADGAAPAMFIDNAPTWVQGHDDNDNIEYTTYVHTLTGGAFAGDMKLVKLGAGKLVLPAVQQKYTGNTEIWFGAVDFDGEMAGSRVWMNRHTVLTSNGGKFSKGLEMNYASQLCIGTADKAGAVTASELVLGFGSRVKIDLFAETKTADQVNANLLKIEKKTWENGPEYSTPIIEFTPNYLAGQTKMPAGEYLLGTIGSIEGNLGDIVIEGLNGQKASVTYTDGKLYLHLSDARDAADIVWKGGNGTTWDLDETANFVFQSTGEATTFVAGDRVIFDDSANGTEINIPVALHPSAIIFNNSTKVFTINGAGFEGNCNIEKKGTARVVLNNVSTFTGKIEINNGVVEVASLGSNEGTATGAFGQYANEIVLNNGGMISIEGDGKLSHPITANEGGIEVTSGTVTLSGATVSGNGTFIKAGAGQFNFSGANEIATLRIDEGVVYDEGDSHAVGETILFNGTKTAELRHMNSTYSYSTDNANFIVPEGKIGKLVMDGRCSYRGTLTGSGKFEVVSSFSRNFIEGDWSEFSGTLTARQSSGNFDYYSSAHLDKAILEVAGTFKNTESQSNQSRNTNMKLGNLTGSGVLGGRGTYYIGYRNEDASFSGTFGSGINFVKEGTGQLTIQKPQPDMGTMTINSGTVFLRLTSESQTSSMTGTSPLVVKGVLKGAGHLANPTATFEAGSLLQPAPATARLALRTLFFEGDLNMAAGSTAEFDIVDSSKYGRISVDGNMNALGEFKVVLDGYTPALDDEFTLWTAGSGDAVPVLTLPELPQDFMWDTSAVTPVNGLIKVVAFTGIDDIAADAIVDVEVYTVDGLVVKSFTAPAGEVKSRCKALGTGTYIINVTGDNKRFTQKLAF